MAYSDHQWQKQPFQKQQFNKATATNAPFRGVFYGYALPAYSKVVTWIVPDARPYPEIYRRDCLCASGLGRTRAAPVSDEYHRARCGR
jgi:hypothetical protein